MTGKARYRILLVLFFACASCAPPILAQRPDVVHRVEGRLQFRGPVNDVRVRIFQRSRMILVDESYARGDGQFNFNRVPTGEYVIETDATDKFSSSSTNITVIPLDLRRAEVFRVSIQLSPKPVAETTRPGVVMADVDLNVPKEAQKRYREGMKALAAASAQRAVSELQAAVKIYPDYYSARLELGRELRSLKRFAEAAEVLKPTLKLAPKRAEPLVEYGVVLMALDRRDEAVAAFSAALQLEETNWGSHLYLGMALLEKEKDEAERHLQRALELNESKAARAHLSLARLEAGRGRRQLAITHLQAYLTLTPEAPDAEPVRQLIERLQR